MRKNKESGQSVVEFALALPVIALLLSGLLDFGRAYFTFIALEEAVAEAALYYALNPECPSDADQFGGAIAGCENPNNALYRAVNSGNDEFDPALADWNIPYRSSDAAFLAEGWEDPELDGCTSTGCNLLVQVRYEFEVFTPGMRFIVGDNTLTLSTQATQIIVFD